MSLKLSIIVPQEINTHQDSMLTEEMDFLLHI